MHQIGEIRTRLLRLAAEAVQQPASSGCLPLTLADSPETYETIWGRICSNEDLDIPSMQEALSTRRCTEIASRCTEQLNINLQSITIRTANTFQEVLDVRIDGFGIAQSVIDAVSDAALSFDNETRNYLDGPRTQQRDAFYQHTSACLKSKAEGIVKRVVDTAMHLRDEVSKDAMSQTPRLAMQDTLTVLEEVLEATDEMQGARPDGLDLKALELLHDLDFSYTRFVVSRIAQRPRDASGILGLSQSICRGLLEWSLKIAASFGVLCDISEPVRRTEKRTNEQLDSIVKHFDNVLVGQFDKFIQQQIHDSKANMSRAFRTGANVPHELNSIYGTLLEGGRRNLNTLCNSLGVTGQKSAALFLQRYSDAIGEE
ncbi:hypothetical protein QR46_3950 [Giardia duodenalis assemblage B]|uniref:Uncharacterized protein n=1 Tax=Giardia duodenalis assemblage B TaxID=1394984 RepID=A0A132NPS2_GIAIN|nr:hypothetical protein QR46_3950 [Giardia intestinalis assemblage B]